MTWQAFVLEYGWRARRDHLAHVLGVDVAAIDHVRRTGAVTAGPARDFADLFTRWHGRAPLETDWPSPCRRGSKRTGQYEWQAPELAQLASLVGRVGPEVIAKVLTQRLVARTGDPHATRTRQAVVLRLNDLGLQTTDVLGGVTVAAAARQIGISSILYNDISHGKLKARRVGRLLVIPHEEFARWRADRVFPPKGFVQLTTLKRPLGIRSDKLSEWARDGLVPTAVRCNPYGTRARSTQYGTWYIEAKFAKKLIADRRAGRPMPWHGKPDLGNLGVTWRLYTKRRHPDVCTDCQAIWGVPGAPTTWDDYVRRYPSLARGAKRHLTRPWMPGLLRSEVAELAQTDLKTVKLAIANGVLPHRTIAGRVYVTRTDATRWRWRHQATGEHSKSWLRIRTAARRYGFTRAALEEFVAAGQLQLRIGTFGAQIGHRLVLKTQVGRLREQLGFSEVEAARRCGVSISRLRVLLRGLEWRPAPRIPLQVVQNVIKRLRQNAGHTISQAARLVKRSIAWVNTEIARGTIRTLRTRWQIHRRYVSRPMLKRLYAAAATRQRAETRWTSEWLLVSDAALLAGVSPNTIQNWSNAGDVATRLRGRFRRFHRRSVMKRARTYWRTEVRYTRQDRRPTWLTAEAA